MAHELIEDGLAVDDRTVPGDEKLLPPIDDDECEFKDVWIFELDPCDFFQEMEVQLETRDLL